jgi:uncharacterized protein
MLDEHGSRSTTYRSEGSSTARTRRKAKQLTIFLSELDTYKHRSLAVEIMHRARSSGLAGSTLIRGIEGYGSSRLIHTSRLLRLSDDLPLVVVIVDSPEAIEKFTGQLDGLIEDSLVVLSDVECFR